jgi:hypothetical protein
VTEPHEDHQRGVDVGQAAVVAASARRNDRKLVERRDEVDDDRDRGPEQNLDLREAGGRGTVFTHQRAGIVRRRFLDISVVGVGRDLGRRDRLRRDDRRDAQAERDQDVLRDLRDRIDVPERDDAVRVHHRVDETDARGPQEHLHLGRAQAIVGTHREGERIPIAGEQRGSEP